MPQQNAAVAASSTINIVLTGAGDRAIAFGSGPAKAEISSDASAFIWWVTGRGSWPIPGAQALGDERALAATRALRVF